MTVRKLNKTKPADILTAFEYAFYGKDIDTRVGVLNPHEYVEHTVRRLIPDIDDPDWQPVYEAVKEAIEKAARGDSNPESVLLFKILGPFSGTRLVVIELLGYTPTDPEKNQGRWTTMRTHLMSLGE